MMFEEYIKAELDRDEELRREYEALASCYKRIEEEMMRRTGYCDYTFSCNHKSECGLYCYAKFNCEHKVKDLVIGRIVGVHMDEYLVTGVEDGWIKVDKETWEEYLKNKKRSVR